jgi:hypothetical protein
MVRLRRRAQSLPEPTTTMLGDAATILIRPVTNILASLAGGAAKLGATRLHSTLIKPCGPDSAVAAGYPRHPTFAIATSLRGPLFPAEPVEHAANAPASSNAFFASRAVGPFAKRPSGDTLLRPGCAETAAVGNQ